MDDYLKISLSSDYIKDHTVALISLTFSDTYHKFSTDTLH